jgi:putative membrane protein
MRTSGWKAALGAAAWLAGATALAQGAPSTGSSMGGSGGSANSTNSGSSTASGSSGTSGQSGGKLDRSLAKAVQKLHAANQAEVQGGQQAAQSAQSPDVKQFAQRMVSDHQQNDQQLQQLAQTMGAPLQGDEFQKEQQDAQKHMQKVQGKTGAEFDKAYMSMMVDDHRKDVKEVEKAAKDAHKHHQAQLASFLDQTHSKMQQHLQEAQRIEKSLGKGGASAQGGSSSSSSQGTGSSR